MINEYCIIFHEPSHTGLAIIRAFRTTARFKRDNEQNVEENQKTQLASQAASQWLGLRLQFIGVAMVTGVVLIAVIQHQFDVADPGIIFFFIITHTSPRLLCYTVIIVSGDRSRGTGHHVRFVGYRFAERRRQCLHGD